MALETWQGIRQKLSDRPSLSIEDTQKYSAAGIDAWTLHLGEVLCERFKFAAQGHRNIANAFNNLPGDQFRQDNFEIGYGLTHVIHVLLKRQDGITLAAIVGVLAESFTEDFVVDLFLFLTERAGVPIALRPLEDQWRRVVQVLYGVLATSTFGKVLALFDPSPDELTGDLDLQNIIGALETMSEMVQSKAKGVLIPCGSEVSFLTAVATWLFDLNFQILNPEDLRDADPSTAGSTQADVVFKLLASRNLSPTGLSSVSTNALPRYQHPVSIYSTGGRVAFERLFKDTFGAAFSSIKDDVLAAYLGCATNMIQNYVQSLPEESGFSFLSHSSGAGSASSFGFLQTIMAWFPELRRLQPRLERHSKLSMEECRATFTQAFEQLKEWCGCPTCSQRSAKSVRLCSITLAELIISLGLYVTRVIVAAKLYPKVRGIRKLYQRLSEARERKLQDSNPVEDFMQRIGRQLPTSVDMLKTGLSLFANSRSSKVDAHSDLMGITYSGMVLFLNGAFKDVTETDPSRPFSLPVTVRVVPGWMCLFGHEAALELYESRFTGWSFERAWKEIRDKRDTDQLFKVQGSVVLTCLMPKDGKASAQARAEGWVPSC